MSLSESRRQEVTEQMWYAAEDCLPVATGIAGSL